MKRKLLSMVFLSLCFFTSQLYARPVEILRINQQKILSNAPNLTPEALDYAIKGYRWALKHHDVKRRNVLTIVDFTKPSYEKRVWVINLSSSKILMRLYTSQGKNSGVVYAKYFSNQPGSDESSLGVYETLFSYDGKHGLSMRLSGLEKGINNNVRARAIVVHPAWYVTPAFVKHNHRVGRSWGCFALNPKKSQKFIDLTRGGSVLFAYASAEQHDPYIATV